MLYNLNRQSTEFDRQQWMYFFLPKSADSVFRSLSVSEHFLKPPYLNYILKNELFFFKVVKIVEIMFFA